MKNCVAVRFRARRGSPPDVNGSSRHLLNGMGRSDVRRVLLDRASILADIRDHMKDRGRQLLGVAADQHSASRRQNPSEVANVGCHHGQAGCKRLEHYVGRTFAVRSEQQHRRIIVKRRNVKTRSQAVQAGNTREIGFRDQTRIESFTCEDDMHILALMQ